MPRHISLLALLLLALSGGVPVAHAAAEGVDDATEAPVEAPASPEVPSEAEESGAEEDALHVAWGLRTDGAVGVRHPDRNETSSADLTVQTPPPER